MNTISEADSRAMVRLLGETAAIQGGHAEMKRFLMNGLCELIGADAWVWTLGMTTAPGAPQAYAAFLHGGFDENRFAKLLRAIEHPAMGEIAARFFQEVEKGSPTTMIRDEIDPDGLAQANGVRQCWENADVGSLLMSGHPLDARSLSALAIYRRFCHPPFTKRKNKSPTSFSPKSLGSMPPAGRRIAERRSPELFPKQRIVLNLLLDGLDRKSIATNLDISENTVAGYAKDVYRHFGVHSQPQLMRKFFDPAGTA